MRAIQATITAAVLLGTLLAALSAPAQIRWQSDLQQAKQVAAQTNRLVLLHFGADWCGPCRELERTVFADRSLGPAIERNFVPVKLNVDHNKQLAQLYQVAGIPADVIITPDGRVVHTSGSPRTASAYAGMLNQVAASARPSVPQAYAQRGIPAHPASRATASTPTGFTGQPRMTQSPGVQTSPYATIGNTPQTPPAGPTNVGARAWSPNTNTHQVARPPAAPVVDRWGGAASGNANTPPRNDGGWAGARSPQPPIARTQPQPPANRAAWQPSAPSYGNQVTTPRPATTAPQQTRQNLPWALDGFCPVSLVQQRRWFAGDKRWGAIHEGQTYLFASEAAQKTFLASPFQYAPVMSGYDPVLMIDRNQKIAGRREYGVYFKGQIYLFSDEGTLQHFSRGPQRYVRAPQQTAQQPGLRAPGR